MLHRDRCRNPSSFRSPLRVVFFSFAILVLAYAALRICAQTGVAASTLDPARDASHLIELPTATLTEQYIWTQPGNEGESREQHARWLLRTGFSLDAIPEAATLYVAASGDVDVWLNGAHLLAYCDDRTQRPGYTVHALDARFALRVGPNALAIRVRRLHGAHHTTTDPLTLQFVAGRALVVKLLPAGRGVMAKPLLVSDASWHGRVLEDDDQADQMDPQSTSTADYDASSWPQVVSLGTIDGNNAFYQWNADAGMYAWPGYVGTSPYLRHYVLRASQIIDMYAGSGLIQNAEQLTQAPRSDGSVFTVRLSRESNAEQSPALTLDFGRETAGRIHLRSDSDQPTLVTVSYGESEEEALSQPFLGVRTIYVPPRGEAWGPKSGFRYVRLRFLTNARFSAINLDGIAYPVDYKGSFSSSDPQLNRIWETAAYTAHLCMQDGIWDGIKRDRARWAGDLDVNGIAGYSALWIDGVADFYRHTGDHKFLLSLRPGLLALLKTMDGNIGSDGLFAPGPHEHVFVDWSPNLSADTPEARRATDFEYLLAYKQAAWLLDEMGDHGVAAHYAARYQELRARAQERLRNTETHTFGATWQTNAMAVLSGAADQKDYPQLWAHVFSNINDLTSYSPAITPYYGYYVLEAMALLGHRAEALQWLCTFWGGMIDEGATSFWEAYDPRWTKKNFHSGLQADGLAGYYVSLAHAWSAGPAAWLAEQVVGIRSTGPGFSTVIIEPELSHLQTVEGSVPTPRGTLHVRADAKTIMLDLPAGTTATIVVNASSASNLQVNGVPARNASALAGYCSIRINRSGHYLISR
jgi:alpha-L-rhamnosidase